MNIHEYQAKSILKEFGVAVPVGIVVDNPSDAVNAAKEIFEKTGFETWAVKAQIHAGGRGKGGGVKIAKSYEEVEKYVSTLSEIIEYVNQISKADVSGVDISSYVFDRKNVLREDEVKDSLDIEKVLQNAPDRKDRFFKVPKIIEEEK